MVFEPIIVGLHHKKYPETIISFQFQDTNFFYLLPSRDKTCLVSDYCLLLTTDFRPTLVVLWKKFVLFVVHQDRPKLDRHLESDQPELLLLNCLLEVS